MSFEIIRNDITKVKADAIVNTANPEPVVGAGTDAAVHQAAGPKLLRARKRIGGIPAGSCRATKGYDLPARYVLHAVSPAWQGGSQGEAALLRKTYDAALDEAARLRCRSVAFPLLAAGNYAFPEELALSTALAAFTDFLDTHDMQIMLVVFGDSAYSLSSALFPDLKSYIDANYVREKKAFEYAGQAARRRGKRESTVFASIQAAEKAETLHPFREETADYTADAMAMPHPSAAKEARPAASTAAFTGAAAARPAASSLEEMLRLTESSFSEHLLDLIGEKGMKDSEVYHRAQVSRQLFNKIINNKDYQPGKSTAIQLALGLELDLPQTLALLAKAGYTLTRSSKADLVVQYHIERKIYSIPRINLALFDCGLPPLKTGLSA